MLLLKYKTFVIVNYVKLILKKTYYVNHYRA